MKYNAILVLVLVLQSCSSPKKAESVDDEIKKVETGLISPVYFEGDSTWSIEERMKHYHVPGVSIAVINDGKIEWVKSYGVMDEETKAPVTNQTLFQAGSISKPVAAYGALKLSEEGKIDINENVNTYLKTWKLPDNEFTKEKKVALKHLLSHTGGLTVHGFWGYSPDLPVPTLVQVLNGEAPANSPPIRVDKAPETGFRYSGGGYTIMQQMVMDIEGKSFPAILKDKVLQPLDMNNSTYDQPLQAEQLKMAATGYLPDGKMTKGKRHTYPEMAAAGLWTTAEDLARFAVNIQQTLKGESKKVLSKDMTEKMLTPFGSEFDGLGLFIDKRKDDIYFGHDGWDEGFSSQMTAHRDKGYGVVVLTNSNHPDFIEELVRSVARTYAWGNYVPVHKKMDMDTSKFSSIRGRYFNTNDGLIKVYTEGNRLFRKYLRGTPTELLQISDSSYMGRENDQLIQFKTNPADGQLNILLVNNDGKQEFTHPKISVEKKVPYEFLLAGDFNSALKGYQALMKANPKDDAVNEENLNGQGYNLLSSDKAKLALDVFKINTMLYPTSANVYDSYAEACAKNGDTDLAIANYKKALAIDPKKESAIKMLAELQKEKGLQIATDRLKFGSSPNSMDTFNINRRHFLKGATATLVMSALGSQAMDIYDFSKTWRVALIGTGWYGKSDLFRLIQVASVEVVALCDVDKNQLKEAGLLVSQRQKSGKVPQLYNDYQKMLAEHPLDIVLIGTPDHWHALQTIDAIKAGADVYVQKPISVDVIEGEAMLAAARKYKRTVQVGLQRRSTPHLMEAKRDVVEAGLLGKISHVEMFCYYHMRNNENPPEQPVPEYFDYERWTGPAPLLPYCGLPHRGWWRSYMEYGNGIMGDMGVHMFDAVRWMLNLGWPNKIYSSGGIYQQSQSKSNITDTQTALFEYDQLTCSWQHRTWGDATDTEYPWGYKIYGEKGTLSCSPMQYDFVPVGEGKKIHRDVVYEREKYPADLQEKNIELHAAPATRLQLIDFLHGIENGNRPVADIEEGHISTACCIIANLSMKTGKPLTYNHLANEFKDDPDANKLLKRTYRASWNHPDPKQV